ncbi:MAG: chitobiase/beta-hexosaminidase C-terminal domain-containing protein [Candidatus Angelobacter sp.]
MDWRKIIAHFSLLVLTVSLMRGQSAPTPDQATLLNQAFSAGYSGDMMDQLYLLAHNSPEVVVADLNQRLAAYPGLVVPGTFLDRVADLYAFAATPSAIDALVQMRTVDPKYLKTIPLLLFYARDRRNPWDLCYYALNEDADTQQVVLNWMTTQVTHPAYYRLLASEMTKKYAGAATQAQLAADPICSRLSPTMLPQLQLDIAAVAQQQVPGYTSPDPPPPPAFSPADGTYAAIQSVTLTDATPNTLIRYTTDGSTPSASSTVYGGPIAVTTATTITAMATAPGFINSDVSSATYVLQTAAPGFSLPGGTYNSVQSVTLSDATPGATIYYTTDGSTPSTSSLLYSGPITVNSTTTINAFATVAGFSNSTVAGAGYTIVLPATAPILSPVGGTYSAVQPVTLSDATQGAAIHYTTDGTTPTASSSVYSTAISVSKTTTIKTMATAAGFGNSPVASATYTLQTAPPTSNPPAGTYTTPQSVSLADATPGAAIHYTTDGSTPTASSPLYSTAISFNKTTTINAMATYGSFNSSAVASATYTIHLPPPTVISINPVSGSTGGSTAIIVTGTNFVAGATVTLAGTAATGVSVVSSTQITATAPAHSAAGVVSVMVTNGDGQLNTLTNSFNYFIPVNNISWMKPSGVSFGPPNTLTVDGSALNGSSPVQTVWRDVTVNGPWNTIVTQSTPDGGGSWANTIPSSNYCHSYAVYANYLHVSSPIFNYVGVGSPYCSETAYVNWIEPPSMAGFGPAGSLVVQGNSTGAPAGTAVAFFWSDVTTGSGWIQAASSTPDASGTWYNYIPNVTYWHQYNVYVIYDAFDTRSGQGVCTYSANGGTTWCPR